MEELHDKYGIAVRIGPNHVSFTSCEAVNAIYAHGGKYNKTNFYQSFQVYAQHPSIFSDIDPKSHADRRRAVSSAYSMTSLVGLEKSVEPLIETLIEKIRLTVKRASNEEQKGARAVLDMSKWMHYFAMDAVGELAFGQSFGFVQKGGDENAFLLGVSNLSHWGSMAGWVPRVSKPVRSILRLSSGEQGGEVVGSMTKPLIDARYSALEQKKSLNKKGTENDDDEIRMDLLAKFIKSKDPKTGKIFSPQQVLTTAISVVGAGK